MGFHSAGKHLPIVFQINWNDKKNSVLASKLHSQGIWQTVDNKSYVTLVDETRTLELSEAARENHPKLKYFNFLQPDVT